MSQARQHHIISECYLKRFTRDGSKRSKLLVVDAETGRSFPTTPDGVAKRRDFNRIEGLPPGELENRLSKFESAVSDSLDRISAARSLDDKDAWRDVVNLMALFAIRNPRRRESFRQFHEQVARVIMDLALATPQRWASQVKMMQDAGKWPDGAKASYEDMKRFHERGRYKFETANALHIRIEFAALESLIKILFARQWVLCIAPRDSGASFITSDEPVCLMRFETNERNQHQPVGFRLRKTTVIFPVTRELLVLGTFEGKSGVREVTREDVAILNGLVCVRSDRQIYAPHDNFPILINGKICTGEDLPAHLRVTAREKKA